MDATAQRPRALVGLLAVLLVVVLVTAAIQLHDRRDAGAVDAQRPADIGAPGWEESSAGRAVLAARTAAQTYFTLDFEALDDDMDAMRALGTPDFVEQYDRGADELAERITADELVLSAAVPRGGTATEYVVTDRARVLVAVEVTTTRGTATGTAFYRTRVALDLVDGDWLVSSLDEVA